MPRASARIAKPKDGAFVKNATLVPAVPAVAITSAASPGPTCASGELAGWIRGHWQIERDFADLLGCVRDTRRPDADRDRRRVLMGLAGAGISVFFTALEVTLLAPVWSQIRGTLSGIILVLSSGAAAVGASLMGVFVEDVGGRVLAVIGEAAVAAVVLLVMVILCR